MLLQYETSRLILKVLKSDSAPLVVDFYNRDKELFEKYEIDRKVITLATLIQCSAYKVPFSPYYEAIKVMIKFMKIQNH